jgi:hypothetical protein
MQTEPSTAVFVDGDWLLVACRQANIPLKAEQLVAALQGEFGDDLAIRAYLSVPKEQGPLREFAVAFGAEMSVRTVEMPRPGKSSIDVQLAVDAGALAPTTRTFVLISGDAGFVPLLNSLREGGRRVVLASFPLHSRALRTAASEFLNLDALLVAAASGGGAGAVPLLGHELPRQLVIDKGQHLRPYLLIRRILIAAKHQVSILDPYLGSEAFDLLGCLETTIEVVIVTDSRHVPRDLGALVTRYRREGRRLRIFSSRDIHDRYLKVDESWWHSGHSFKDLGNRVSQLTRVEQQHVAALCEIEQRTIAAATELLPHAA